MEAIESGDESGVKRCLDDGADAMFADDEGFTALHMACQEGYQEMVTMLLRKGAKVDSTDDDGVTPLMVASEAGHESVVTLLVAENADVNLADKAGKTAILRAAAIAGSEACVSRLLAASADVFACPAAGKTLADLAEKKDAATVNKGALKEQSATAGQKAAKDAIAGVPEPEAGVPKKPLVLLFHFISEKRTEISSGVPFILMRPAGCESVCVEIDCYTRRPEALSLGSLFKAL